MFNILVYNFGFWFNIIIPIAIGFYLYMTNKEYILKEFGIQILASFGIVTILYFLLFSTTTDIYDKEYQNSEVKSFEYYEQWTEKVVYTETQCSGSGKNQSCRTVTKVRYDYHPPYWQINTKNNETVSISSNNYRNAVSKYSDKKEFISRMNQSSFGDGNKYVSYPNEVLPTAVSHSYVNYVKAAKDNVIHNKFTPEEIDVYIKSKDLKEYPKEYTNELGVPQIYRVIDTTGLVNVNEWTNKLHFIANDLGKSKQSNLVIYFTKKDITFASILEYYWAKCKKNDVVLVIGVSDKGEIQWTNILAWTNNTNFLVDGTKFLRDFNYNVSNTNEVLLKFKDLVSNDFERKPMKEFDYLAENITLEWYWQFLIILINIVSSFFITRYFLTNCERKY